MDSIDQQKIKLRVVELSILKSKYKQTNQNDVNAHAHSHTLIHTCVHIKSNKIKYEC